MKPSSKRIAKRIFGVEHPAEHTETLRAAHSDIKIVARNPARVRAVADWHMWKAEGESSAEIARIARVDRDELVFKQQPGQPLGSTIPNEVVEQYTPQIRRWMRHFGISRDKDAFHVAVMGVCEALDRYDPTTDIGIGPYAENYIKGELADHLAEFTKAGDAYATDRQFLHLGMQQQAEISPGKFRALDDLLPSDPLSLLHSDLGMEKLWQMFGDLKGVEADVFLAMIRNTERLPVAAWHGISAARISQIEKRLWRQLADRLDVLQVIRDPGINAVYGAAFSARYWKPSHDAGLVAGLHYHAPRKGIPTIPLRGRPPINWKWDVTDAEEAGPSASLDRRQSSDSDATVEVIRSLGLTRTRCQLGVNAAPRFFGPPLDLDRPPLAVAPARSRVIGAIPFRSSWLRQGWKREYQREFAPRDFFTPPETRGDPPSSPKCFQEFELTQRLSEADGGSLPDHPGGFGRVCVVTTIVPRRRETSLEEWLENGFREAA